MKKTGCFIFLLYCTLQVSAQVSFSNISLSAALREAKSTDKILALVVESPDCNQCNQVALQGLSNPLLDKSTTANCIWLLIHPRTKDRQILDSLLPSIGSFGLMFLDSDAQLLHRYNGSTTQAAVYRNHIEKALDSKRHPDTIYTVLLGNYREGIRTFELLYALVAKQNEKDILHDPLTEEMLNLVPSDSANSVSFIRFLAEQAPVVRSKTDLYMHKNNALFNEAWYQLPLQKRVMINNRIGSKSKAKAILEKNRVYAEAVAKYIRGTYAERTAGEKAYDRILIDYFQGIHDTTAFLLHTVKFYDKYLMQLDADSVRRVDSLRRMEMIRNALPADNLNTAAPGKLLTATIRYAPLGQAFTNELNEGAWAVYTHTHDTAYTGRALQWSEKALDFFESPEALDTYARLLYRMERKKEAAEAEERAIALCRQRKQPATVFENILAAMRAEKANIDNY
jgi:hypothetical protein